MTSTAARWRVLRVAAVAVLAFVGGWVLLGPPTFAAVPVVDAQLEITRLDDSADPVAPGERFAYGIAATNLGPSGTFEGVVVDTLPDEVVFVRVVAATATTGDNPTTIPCSHDGSPSGGQVRCDIGLMAPPPTATRVSISIEVDVLAGVSPRVVSNDVEIFSEEVGLNIKGESDNETTTIGPDCPSCPPLSLDLTVDADGDGAFADQEARVGTGEVRYRARLTNEREFPLTIVDLRDTLGGLGGVGDCLPPPAATLPVGGSLDCEFTATVAGAAGKIVTNGVTATVDDGVAAGSASDSAFVRIDQLRISVTTAIDADGDGAFSARETAGASGAVEYRVEIRNLEAAPVVLTALVDDLVGAVGGRGTCLAGGDIAGNGAYQCVYPATVSGAAGATVSNFVTATVRDAAGNTVSGSDGADAVIGGRGGGIVTVAMTVDANGDGSFSRAESAFEGARTVRWRVEITTGGSAPVSLDGLTDDQGSLAGRGSCSIGVTIGASPYSCSFTTEERENAGASVARSATATVGGSSIGSGDAVAQFIDRLPTLSADLSGPSSAAVGTELARTVRIVNTSPAATDPVTVDTIRLSQLGAVTERPGSTCAPRTLAPGQVYSCIVREAVTAPAGTTLDDTVVVSGRDDEGNAATASDPHSVEVPGAPEPTREDLDVALIDLQFPADSPPLDEERGQFRYRLVVLNRTLEATPLPDVWFGLPSEVAFVSGEGCTEEPTPSVDIPRIDGVQWSQTIRCASAGELAPLDTRDIDVLVEVAIADRDTAVAQAGTPSVGWDAEPTPVRGGGFLPRRAPRLQTGGSGAPPPSTVPVPAGRPPIAADPGTPDDPTVVGPTPQLPRRSNRLAWLGVAAGLVGVGAAEVGFGLRQRPPGAARGR